jgi:putative aldouronate transport system substrate-binding protein
MKKLAALFLALLMVLSVASFSVAEEPVKLIWWWFTDSQQPTDWDMVEEKLNEISKAAIGVEVDVRYLTNDQVTIAQTAGEAFDLAFTCDWYNDFATNVAQGMFLDITELVPQYAPKLLEEIPDYLWTGGTVNDVLYAIPHMKDTGMEIFWILDEEYFINQKGLEKDHYISFEEIEPYMEMYKADYPDDYPLKIAKGGITSWMNALADWISMDYLIGLDWEAQGTENETTVYCALELPAFQQRLATIHSWYEKGYINPDAAVLETYGRSVAGVIQSGQGWFGAETTWSNARQKASYIARYDGIYMSTSSLRGSMTAVSATTQYPEKALELVQFMNTNEEYRTMARYGLEGVHYTVKEPGIVQVTEQGMANFRPQAYSQGTYVLGPVEASPFESVPADPDMWQKVWDSYADAKLTAALGFTLDVTPIETELLAIASIWNDYRDELITGTSDPAEMVPVIIEEMEGVGLREVLAEVQAQMDAFIGK